MIGTLLALAACGSIRISEVRVDSLPPLADVCWVELTGVAGEATGGLHLVVIGETWEFGSPVANSGVVVCSAAITVPIPADRALLLGGSPFMLAIPDIPAAVGMGYLGNFTVLVVAGSAPPEGMDLDQDEDGVLDWPLAVVDSVAFQWNQPPPVGYSGHVYSSAVVGGGDGWVVWGGRLCLDSLAWGTLGAVSGENETPGGLNPVCGGTTCVGDLDGDGIVGSSDMSAMLGSWGDADGPCDLDRSGVVDAADLAIMLNAWGDCPGW